MDYSNEQLIDIIEWDIVNWGQAIKYWDRELDFCKINYCLEIGARRGGLSLWLALHGIDTIECSDRFDNSKEALSMHRKYGLNSVQYKVINATEINQTEKYDLICFKSVLGGIGYNNNKSAQEKAINEIYCALKPGGLLIFTENLKGSKLHTFLRKNFVKWGDKWRYLSLDELLAMTNKFNNIQYKTYGFFGTMGRKEWQRYLLGKLDSLIDPFINEKDKYISIFICKK